MKILIYGEYFLPVVGGVQTSIALLAKGLVSRRGKQSDDSANPVEVTVVTRTLPDRMDDAALPYAVVRRPSLARLVNLIRRADVVHLAGPCLLPLFLAWLMRKPVVIEHHGYQAVCPNGLLLVEPAHALCPGHFMERGYKKCLRCCSQNMGTLGGMRALLWTFPRRWLCKRVAANVTISNHVGSRLKLPRSSTIYYGIEETMLAAGRNEHSGSSALNLAYVGRLVAEKGLPILLQAAKCLQQKGVEFQLRLIGDGPERSRLEELVRGQKLHDRVTFTGDLRGAALDEAVGKVDVVVMPSVWEETAGLAAIEQMMRGRAVVAADIGGLSEVVGDAGWKFPPGDPEALCACLQQVARAPEQIVALGRQARQRAQEKFALRRMVAEHLALYEQLAGERRQAGS